jgi:hypothetical protein
MLNVLKRKCPKLLFNIIHTAQGTEVVDSAMERCIHINTLLGAEVTHGTSEADHSRQQFCCLVRNTLT